MAKARWVIDGNVWTSSGVSAGTSTTTSNYWAPQVKYLYLAGSDMALAFVSHLAGPEVARVIRGQAEIVEVSQEDDPFAAFHGLV